MSELNVVTRFNASASGRIAIIASFLALYHAVAVAAPPSNDNFTSPRTVLNTLPNTVTGTTVEATKEPGEPNHAGRQGGASVWFRFETRVTATYTFSTAGSNFDTLLAVYAGTTVSNLTQLAANDDFGSSVTSQVSVALTAGQVVRIAIDGFAAATGNYVLTVTAPPPPNDNIASALVLSNALPLTISGSNLAATPELTDPLFPNISERFQSSVWYRWTPNRSGRYRINTIGSNFDTVLGVYRGPVSDGLAFLAYNDDIPDGGDRSSEVVLDLAANTPVFLTINGFGGGQGTIQLNISIVPPTNDNRANSLYLVGGLPISRTGSNTGATKEPGELPIAGDNGGSSVWFSADFFPGTYVISTAGSDFDTLLAVRTLGNVLIAENDDAAPWLRSSRVQFTINEFFTLFITVDGFNGESGFYNLDVSLASQSAGLFEVQKTSTLTTNTGWLPSGQTGPLFSSAIGDRGFDPSTGALEAIVAPSPRARIIGFIEDAATDMPYSAVGPGRHASARFHVYYSGPGDSTKDNLFNKVPNFRLGLRTRGMVNTQLEVQHNAQTGGSPGQAFVTRELAPSKDPDRPSIYRVDLDPLDVPFWTESADEGIQRTFETLVSGGDFSFVEGTLALTETSIGTYPSLSPDAPVVKVLGAGGAPGAADFDNGTIITTTIGYSAAEIFRYLAGPNPADYFNPAILTPVINAEPNVTITKTLNGIVVNTGGLPNTRIAVADAAFTGGRFGDSLTSFLRVDPGRIYRVSFRVNQDGPSNSTPFVRFNVRTAGFGWNQTYELLGARGLASSATQAGLAQILPGAGNVVPGTTEDGTTYHMIFRSPMDPAIRNDITGTLEQKMPKLTAQPGFNSTAIGEGNPAGGSLRNVNFGFTVADSLSLISATQTSPEEVANNLVLNRIEVRTYTEVENP